MGVAASRQEAFWEACGFGHKERVKKFLESGDIDVNWVSYTHDCCPIHVASQGKSEIVRMLIEAKCNVNVQDIRGNTPVHHAAMKGHADIIKTLVEAGAEVNTQDKNSWTALHCAAYWNHSKAVRVLLNLGADVSLLNKDKRTPLHETARSREKDDQTLGEITQMLIAEGSDVNCKGCSDLGDLEADFTGLMYAAYHNHPDVASALIEGECDINAHGSNLWTALHWAADRGHEEMVYLLLGSGADPTKRGQRNELAADRAEKPELKEILLNAVNMYNELEVLNHDSTPTDKQTSKNQHLEKNTDKSDIIDLTQSANKNLAKEEISDLHEECEEGTNEIMSGSNIDCCMPEEQSDNLSNSVDKLSLVTEQSMPCDSHISPSVTDTIETDKVTNTETIEAEEEISDNISKCNNDSDSLNQEVNNL